MIKFSYFACGLLHTYLEHHRKQTIHTVILLKCKTTQISHSVRLLFGSLHADRYMLLLNTGHYKYQQATEWQHVWCVLWSTKNKWQQLNNMAKCSIMSFSSFAFYFPSSTMADTLWKSFFFFFFGISVYHAVRLRKITVTFHCCKTCSWMMHWTVTCLTSHVSFVWLWRSVSLRRPARHLKAFCHFLSCNMV